jgi:LacI family transcriptional regulator
LVKNGQHVTKSKKEQQTLTVALPTLQQQRHVGIKEIAKELGLSIGTVDRALHNRGRISADTRDRVLKMVQDTGYRPNLAARSLKSPRPLRMSIHLPAQVASFYEAIREGVCSEAARYESAVELCFRTHTVLGEGETELFDLALADGSKGLILAPGHPHSLLPWLKMAADRRIPVVCVATEAVEGACLSMVCADGCTSGAIAAEILGRFVHPRGDVAVMTGDHSTVDHTEKLRGFENGLAKYGPHLHICAVIETHDNEEQAYRSAMDLYQNKPRMRAIYVNTANSVGVIRAAVEADPQCKVAIVTTDLFPELVEPLRSGRILATIHQHPKKQGRIAFEVLNQYLTQGTVPPPRITLNPQIVLRSNLDLYLRNALWDAD